MSPRVPDQCGQHSETVSRKKLKIKKKEKRIIFPEPWGDREEGGGLVFGELPIWLQKDQHIEKSRMNGVNSDT